MSKHTPGPWEVQMESCECEPPCGCDNPYPYKIRTLKRRVFPYQNDPQWDEPQEIVDFMEVNVPLPVPEARANAYLIAAAPDLLEALENLINNCECRETGTVIADFSRNTPVDAARAAIAKAKGVE